MEEVIKQLKAWWDLRNEIHNRLELSMVKESEIDNLREEAYHLISLLSAQSYTLERELEVIEEWIFTLESTGQVMYLLEEPEDE